LEGPSCSSVISIPGLIDVWELILEGSDEREEEDAIA
jgi:hypothetical protein